MNFVPIYLGIVVGTIARIALLKVDYRNYPSYPNGVLIHVTLGFIAAILGAVAVPALLARQWVAVTFLALAIQQFREVRKLETASLVALESAESVPRGSAYIDGIAKSFEARNYVVLLVALATTGTANALKVANLWLALAVGAGVGVVALVVLKLVVQDKRVRDVANVREAQLHFEGSYLYADDIYLDNIGLERFRKRIEQGGLAVVIEPQTHAGHITLSNLGQRRAIIHEVSRVMGLKRYHGMRRDFKTGNVGFYFVPMEKDIHGFIRTVENVPLLESVRRDKNVSGPGGMDGGGGGGRPVEEEPTPARGPGRENGKAPTENGNLPKEGEKPGNEEGEKSDAPVPAGVTQPLMRSLKGRWPSGQ